jgi:glutamate formiminotransferase
VFECVVNISEGRDPALIAAIADAAGACLVDVHSDPDHHRSVLTLGGEQRDVEAAAREVAKAGVTFLDIRDHRGVHPRIGVVDVVPFVDLDHPREVTDAALGARDRFAAWAGDDLEIPCFLYGPERTLPQVRREAFGALAPDTGPHAPHLTAGAMAVGARAVLVAYNLWLADAGLPAAQRIARELRSPAVRALGLAVGSATQVSCNLVAPWQVGPAEVYDLVASRATITRAELVGLLPVFVLDAVPSQRRRALGLTADQTIEARLHARGGS